MDKALLQRYFKDQCTPEEKEAVLRWIETDAEKWYDDHFDQYFLRDLRSASDAETDEILVKVMQLIGEKQQSSSYLKPAIVVPMKRRASALRWWIAAACVILLAGLGWLISAELNRTGNRSNTELAWISVSNMDQPSLSVVLPDQSKVVLRKGSSFRYPSSFNTQRTLEMEGEAFFDITHDNEKPFTVKAGSATTTVYGTAFNIQAYPQDGNISIALQRGKIGIRYAGEESAADEKILTPGELFQVNKKTEEIALSSIPVEQMGSWQSGGLLFYNTPLADVFAELERMYNVHFEAGESIYTDHTFTAYFPDASLERVLNHLRFTGDLQFEQHGNRISVK